MQSRRRLALAACLATALALPALAEVESVSDTAFAVEHQVEATATPAQSYSRVIQPALWWSSAHTWSGSADNLRLEPRAGGCFCERWEEGEVEHLRVVEVRPEQRLRLRGALGPLASHALDGVLEFNLAVATDPERTVIRLSYRVAGHYPGGLAALAPAVDAMLGEQLKRFAEGFASDLPDPTGAASADHERNFN